MITPQQNNFTALRLLLALLVVLGHFTTLPSDIPARGLFSYGTFAVDTFFVISGYLIFGSFDTKPVIGSFYIRRIFRIYPLYLTVVIVQALIMAALAGGIVENGAELLRYLSLNLILANFLAYDIGGLLSGLHNPGINPSLWTLKIEFAFYLLLPLLWYFTQRFGWRFLLLLYVLSTAYVMITLHYGMDILAKQLPGQLRFFVVGMALYHYRHRLVFPLLPTIIVTGILFILSQFYHDLPLVMPLNPICSGLVMLLFVFRLPHIPLSFDISYGIYLLHGPLIQLSLLFGIFHDTLGFLALLLASVMLLAFAAERIIELPGINLGKRLAKDWTMHLVP
jgi:peptidoglycan/LPS O-acetylase OafA/YrhL